MFTIQTFNKIAATGLGQFSAETYEVAPDASMPDAIVLRSQNLHDMELPASLKAIARAGAGVNNIPVDACSARGIVVFGRNDARQIQKCMEAQQRAYYKAV